MTKTWLKRDAWVQLALCWGSDAHTAEDPDDEQLAYAAAVCGDCPVRYECAKYAVETKMCSVVIAGVYLPDPIHKEELRMKWKQLQDSLPDELEARGEI